ncbi:MAG: TetR/AcrR family transcriptional regulator [Labilithrix sp.]|nr:TetR/AcrR family transcriptional regulator [Labilithrix sp.]
MANAGYLPGPARRQQIVDSAKRVFAARGYHQTNISHICDDLGIGRGTLYQYFGSKQDVFRAIIESLLERVREAIASAPVPAVPEGVLPTRGETELFFAISLRRLLDVVFEDEASLRILFREAVGLDVHVDAILQAIDDIVIDRFSSDLEIGKRAGIVRPDIDTRAAALYAMGGIEKLALFAIRRGHKLDIDAIVRETSRMTMNGLLAEEVKP